MRAHFTAAAKSNDAAGTTPPNTKRARVVLPHAHDILPDIIDIRLRRYGVFDYVSEDDWFSDLRHHFA